MEERPVQPDEERDKDPAKHQTRKFETPIKENKQSEIEGANFVMKKQEEARKTTTKTPCLCDVIFRSGRPVKGEKGEGEGQEQSAGC